MHVSAWIPLGACVCEEDSVRKRIYVHGWYIGRGNCTFRVVNRQTYASKVEASYCKMHNNSIHVYEYNPLGVMLWVRQINCLQMGCKWYMRTCVCVCVRAVVLTGWAHHWQCMGDWMQERQSVKEVHSWPTGGEVGQPALYMSQVHIPRVDKRGNMISTPPPHGQLVCRVDSVRVNRGILAPRNHHRQVVTPAPYGTP